MVFMVKIGVKMCRRNSEHLSQSPTIWESLQRMPFSGVIVMMLLLGTNMYNYWLAQELQFESQSIEASNGTTDNSSALSDILILQVQSAPTISKPLSVYYIWKVLTCII